MKVFVTIGVSASGKSTWADSYARENNGLVINRDSIRKLIVSTQQGRLISDAELWKLWAFKHEDEVTRMYDIQLDTALRSMEFDCIILSDTFLNEVFRNEMLTRLSDKYGVQAEIVKFPIELDVAIERDKNREASVGEPVIRSQYKKWLQYLESKQE